MTLLARDDQPELQHVSTTLPSFLSALSKGVQDIAVPQAPHGRQGSACVGIRSFVGPIHVELLAEALSKITTSTETTFRDVSVDPIHVLAQPALYGKLHTYRSQLRLGEKIDPVQLHRLSFPGLPPYYSVMDGRHRATAARLSGKREIAAVLQLEILCDPDAFFIDNGVLTPMGTSEPQQSPTRLPRDLVDLLEALGVRVTRTEPA